MNRLEKSNDDYRAQLAQTERDANRRVAAAIEAARREAADIKVERDVGWEVQLDTEEDGHDRRHKHVATVQKYNDLVWMMHRLLDGTLSPEAREQLKIITPLPEPPRLPDVRTRIRTMTEKRRRDLEHPKGE